MLHIGKETAGHGGIFSARLDGQYLNGLQRLENFTYYGRVGFDYEAGYILVELLRSSEPYTVATVTARVDLDSPHDQDIMLGYYMAYSQHYQRMLCKVIVLQRITGQTRDAVDAAANSKEFRKIKPAIRNFLANRAQNRLTMPSSIIAHLSGKGRDKTLSHWVDKHRQHIENDAILNALQGEYVVCYYFGEQLTTSMSDEEINQQVRKNVVAISYNEQNVEFVAHYQHLRLDPSNHYWGSVSRKLFTIEIILKDKRASTDLSTDVNHIFLSFSVPITDEKVLALSLPSFPMFHGVISGLNDEELTPVAFAAALVRLEPARRPAGFSHTAAGIDSLLTDDQHAQIAHFFRLNQRQLRIHMPIRTVDYLLPNYFKWLAKDGTIVIANSPEGILLRGFTTQDQLKPVWETSAFHSLDEAQRSANGEIAAYYLTNDQKPAN